jgi:hypothetical protein
VWHIAAWAGRALGVLLIVYVLLTLYYLTGRPAPHHNYLADLNADTQRVPPDERAWPLYRQPLMALDCQVAVKRPTLSASAQEARPGDAEWPLAVEYLSNHADAFSQLRAAAARPHLGYEVGFSVAEVDQVLLGSFETDPPEFGAAHPHLFQILLPHLQALRSGARLLHADTYRALEAGDGTAAYEDVVAILGMSRQIGESPFLVGGLVAMAVEGFACDAIGQVMAQRPDLWTDRQLADLAHQLAGRQFDVDSWLESERTAQYDMIQRVYTDNGRGDGRITYAGLAYLGQWMDNDAGYYLPSESHTPFHNRAIALAMPIAVGAVASRAAIEQKTDHLFALAANDMQTPLWEQGPDYADELYRLEKKSWAKYGLVLRLFPAVQAMERAVVQADGRTDGAMIGLALELYRRETGAWPKTLDELAPRWIPALPVDRINGGPLGYRIVDDRSLVYSLGVDSDDDGGRLPENCHGDRWKYNVGPPDSRATDGDWVIWSTVRSEVQEIDEHP